MTVGERDKHSKGISSRGRTQFGDRGEEEREVDNEN